MDGIFAGWSFTLSVGLTALTLAVTAELRNPLDVPITALALALDVYHAGAPAQRRRMGPRGCCAGGGPRADPHLGCPGSGGSNFLGTADLAAPVEIEGRGIGRLATAVTVPYSATLLSSGVDFLSEDLVLDGRDGLLTVGVGAFAVTVNFEHADILETLCAAAGAGAAGGGYFAPGGCHAATGETCALMACAASLGPTLCVDATALQVGGPTTFVHYFGPDFPVPRCPEIRLGMFIIC